jgi:hypothetical protein
MRISNRLGIRCIQLYRLRAMQKAIVLNDILARCSAAYRLGSVISLVLRGSKFLEPGEWPMYAVMSNPILHAASEVSGYEACYIIGYIPRVVAAIAP